MAIVHDFNLDSTFRLLGLGTAVTVQGFRFEQLSTFGEKTKLATILTLALAALGDYLLAGTIIASLYRNRATRASLNARNLMVNRGINIFSDNSESYGRNILSRVNRLATAERWNVPQAPDDGLPPVINVKVAAEIEVHGQSDGDSIRNYDVKGLPSTAP
ncbi:hypothetical protein BN946_scf184772.g2 [Trametes cinnabarina]|uniref:Uncharacterized protein n=1 Tax=Pycnoporus cinnabarinus TaxID=5643 RepID=A0A060SL61_PYCCI|nr:hypothetical protein BN946_scf184772.g2 [Trametes cinnabarina]